MLVIIKLEGDVKMYYVRFGVTPGDEPVMYKVSEFNEEIKKALGIVTMYGDDMIDLVFKGEVVEQDFELKSLKKDIKDFVEEDYGDVYFNDSDPDYIKWCIKLLDKVALY